MSHKEIFTDIYDNNVWGGSGGGSMPSVNQEYMALIQHFLKYNKIKTIVDYGCGDMSFSRLMDWRDVKYTGIDCVKSVIENNIKLYSTENIGFVCDERIKHGADLLLLKDVLQHWTNEQVVKFLDENTSNFKFVIITNNSGQTEDWQDSKMPHVQTRPLSAKFFPLKKYHAEIMLETNINEPKETSLITTII